MGFCLQMKLLFIKENESHSKEYFKNKSQIMRVKVNHSYLYALILGMLLVGTSVKAQKEVYKISYLRSSHDKVMPNQDAIVVFASANETAITSESILKDKAPYPFERYFVNRRTNAYYKTASFGEGKSMSTIDDQLISKQKLVITDETKMILGHLCRKATTSINSNSIELWFTDALAVKGAPTELGQDLGLVLEMVRNGNTKTTASEIIKLKSFPPALKLPVTENVVDELTYKDLLWKSRFIDLSIFTKEQINFVNETKSDSVLRFANGTVILKKVKIPKINSGSSIFIELVEQSRGDAYDRTGSVFLIPTDQELSFLDGMENGMKTLPFYENGNGKKYQGVVRTNQYSPLIELIRFFTPFGVKGFNHIQLKGKQWQDSVSYRQDISEFYDVLSNQEVWIGTFIGNYDGGGHQVSLNLTVHSGYSKRVEAKKIMPLFNTNNVMEMAGQDYATMFDVDKGLEVTFTLKQDRENVQLRYITTGHGGWGNGDEFVPKVNTIFLDDKKVFQFTPWRTDCGSYRLYNPASGNFANGLSSSDLSRSNWCPGTLTNPNYIDLGNLKAGTHTMRIHIPQGKPEGTSFSAWNVSGVLISD